MRIIARRTLREYCESLHGTADYGPVKAALESWFQEAQKADWSSPAAVKRQYANASIVANDRVVFNIKGNSYRLVAAIDYVRKVVFIKWVGTHGDYDDLDAAKVKYAGKTHKKSR